jgi:hypothetical protein
MLLIIMIMMMIVLLTKTVLSCENYLTIFKMHLANVSWYQRESVRVWAKAQLFYTHSGMLSCPIS